MKENFERPISSTEFRVSINVQTNIPVRGKNLHRIAAYRLSDVCRNMRICNAGYDFSDEKLVSRQTDEKDPILEDGDMVIVHVQR